MFAREAERASAIEHANAIASMQKGARRASWSDRRLAIHKRFAAETCYSPNRVFFMDAAAFLPAPMARMTVAAPVTASPPA